MLTFFEIFHELRVLSHLRTGLKHLHKGFVSETTWLSYVLGYLSRLRLRHWWNLRGSKHINIRRIWLLHLLLNLRVTLIHHINLMSHTLSSHALVSVISAHLATVTSHHAGWCYHLILIHNDLLLGIYHVDIGSLTSNHIILRRVLLWLNEIKAWQVRSKLCFVL